MSWCFALNSRTKFLKSELATPQLINCTLINDSEKIFGYKNLKIKVIMIIISLMINFINY